MNGEHQHTVRLPLGYRATFVFRPSPLFLEVFWEPGRPCIESRRAQRKFFAAYVAERDAFLRDAAAMLGGSIIIADAGGELGGVTVIRPEARH